MKGTCLCGSVSFEIIGAITNLYQCHCSLCQKATGSNACAAFITDSNGVRWLAGQEYINSFTCKNGFRTDFCRQCGSPLPNKINLGDYMWIPAGTLDEPLQRKIVAHIHTASRACWESNVGHAIEYAHGPESITAFFASLKNTQD